MRAEVVGEMAKVVGVRGWLAALGAVAEGARAAVVGLVVGVVAEVVGVRGWLAAVWGAEVGDARAEKVGSVGGGAAAAMVAHVAAGAVGAANPATLRAGAAVVGLPPWGSSPCWPSCRR